MAKRLTHLERAVAAFDQQIAARKKEHAAEIAAMENAKAALVATQKAIKPRARSKGPTAVPAAQPA